MQVQCYKFKHVFSFIFVNRILGTSLQWVNNWVCIEIDILKEEEEETFSTISSPTNIKQHFFSTNFVHFWSKNLGDV
jgi:hypothetical protein